MNMLIPMMGIMMAGNGLGPFIFSPLVTWMIFTWDWQTAYVILSINMTICLLISCAFIRNHPHDMGTLPYGAQPAPAITTAAGATRGRTRWLRLPTEARPTDCSER